MIYRHMYTLELRDDRFDAQVYCIMCPAERPTRWILTDPIKLQDPLLRASLAAHAAAHDGDCLPLIQLPMMRI